MGRAGRARPAAILAAVPEAIRQGDIPGVQLRRRQKLAVGIEEAWGWLVEPERLAQWVGGAVSIATAGSIAARADAAGGASSRGGPTSSLDRGAALEISRSASDGSPRRERAETLEIESPLRWMLAFRELDAGWPVATRLTLELAARPGGSELSILQEGFEHLPLSRCLTIWEEYRRRWAEALERLAELTERGS